jgi:hypothetical protein
MKGSDQKTILVAELKEPISIQTLVADKPKLWLIESSIAASIKSSLPSTDLLAAACLSIR